MVCKTRIKKHNRKIKGRRVKVKSHKRKVKQKKVKRKAVISIPLDVAWKMRAKHSFPGDMSRKRSETTMDDIRKAQDVIVATA